jgi:lipoate-protein ligase A
MLGADLEVGGAKICGSAQVRRRGWFLQHGSIPISDVRDETYGVMQHPETNVSTCIELLRPGTSWEEVADCVILGFSRAWGAAPVLTPLECLLSAGAGEEVLA